MSSPFLSVESLGRVYDAGDVHALANVSFSASAGDIVAITGPSGCGKSTLLSLIGLLDAPTSGRVLLAGADAAALRHRADFRARHIGFVFQFHHLVPTMTMLENVAAPMIPLGVGRRQRHERASAMLGRMGIEHRANALPSRVSGGERQRAAVARALVNTPMIVLADEPTGNLDTTNSNRVMQLLTACAREAGSLVLVATHNPGIAASADRCIELRDGRLVADTAHALEAGYAGRFAEVTP